MSNKRQGKRSGGGSCYPLMNFPGRQSSSRFCIVVGEVAGFGIDLDHCNIRVGACGWVTGNRSTGLQILLNEDNNLCMIHKLERVRLCLDSRVCSGHVVNPLWLGVY
jgi:hypothetical protein